jgi:phage tail-like protein
VNKKQDDRNDPFVNFAFRVEIDGIEVFGFQEVSGLVNETDIYEYQEGGENQYTHKLIGQTKFSNIVLKHGITTDNSIYEWRQKVIDGDIPSAKKSGTVTLFNKRGGENKSWKFKNGWPSKLQVEPFNSMANTISVSLVEIAVESVEESK